MDEPPRAAPPNGALRPRDGRARVGRGWFWALAALTLAALCPPALNLMATGVAAGLGCALDEGSPPPCRWFGWDIGGSLYEGYVLGGWLSLVAAPALLAALIGWGALAIARWRVRRGAAAP